MLYKIILNVYLDVLAIHSELATFWSYFYPVRAETCHFFTHNILSFSNCGVYSLSYFYFLWYKSSFYLLIKFYLHKIYFNLYKYLLPIMIFWFLMLQRSNVCLQKYLNMYYKINRIFLLSVETNSSCITIKETFLEATPSSYRVNHILSLENAPPDQCSLENLSRLKILYKVLLMMNYIDLSSKQEIRCWKCLKDEFALKWYSDFDNFMFDVVRRHACCDFSSKLTFDAEVL